jgi:hypothetical protein
MRDLTPYICVTDSRAAIEWYPEVFQATVRGKPHVMDDGRIGHAELEIGSWPTHSPRWTSSRPTHQAAAPCRCTWRSLTAMQLPKRPYATAHSSIAGPSQPVTVDQLPSMIPSGTAG